MSHYSKSIYNLSHNKSIHIVDNALYSWGSSENGRLGIACSSNKSGDLACAHPRPIFGALHYVPDLACRHWHTIIIAGNQENDKVGSPLLFINKRVIKLSYYLCK